MANKEHVKNVIQRIEADPASFDMADWASLRYDDDDNVCGTTLCVAGHAAVLDGAVVRPNAEGNLRFYRGENEVDPEQAGRDYLELTDDDVYTGSGHLFYVTNSDAMAHLRKLAA